MPDRTPLGVEPPRTVPPAPGAAAKATIVERKSWLSRTALIAGLAILVAVAAGWFILGRGDSADAPSDSPSGNSALIAVHLEGFTVNLADREENHFLRVTMDLAVDHLPSGAEKDKPGARFPMAHIRDTILSVLTECQADALLTADGKNQLKKKLVEALNRAVPDVGVRDIYFTEFLVQR
jgi:flagellar FliL protein